MRRDGRVRDPGFVRAGGAAARSSTTPAASRRSRTAAAVSGTVYLGFPDESFPPDHPRQWLGNYGVGAVAYDLFPADSPIRRLYEWDELRAFVAAILGLDDDLSRTPTRSARSTSR